MLGFAAFTKRNRNPVTGLRYATKRTRLQGSGTGGGNDDLPMGS